jgi:V8-like Glu-specific endopeptidase
MRKPLRRIVLAALPIGLLLAAPTIANNRSTTRVGPEKAVGGVTVEERAAREAGLHAWLTEERPRGALDAPIRVELTRQEKIDLEAPAPRRAGAEPLRIGLVKSIAPAIEFFGLRHGHGDRVAGGILQATPDGGFLWTAAITSPGATGIRLHLRNVSLPADADLYFYSLEGDVRGPYQGRGPDRSGEFWTNTVFSDTGVIALRSFGPHTRDDLRNVSFAITDLGYIGRGFPIPVPQGHNWDHDQCGNANCVLDANCGGLGPAGPAADAVAKMEWIQGAFIYTCTGGLIADTDGGSQRNLFLTANHCLSKSNANLETFFFYTTSSCNGNCPGSPSPDTTGATVLDSGRSGDYTLLELNGNPPAGTTFLGWNSAPIAFTNGADLYRVSNPNFGPQVFSHHAVDANAETCSGWPRGERIYSNDLEGATDGGSSGSPVVNSASEVVGQLSGCCGFNCGDVCDTGANSTVDGALAHYFDNVASILDPAGGGCSSNAECDDGQFCNGAETCAAGSCQAGADPCPGQGCDEGADQCVSCTLLPKGASCTADAECCSNKCKGPPSNKTCR